MSDSSAFGFGKFIPGFDFLQNLSKAGQPPAAMPSFSHWVAPTMSVEEIDKRIEELKAVQFWLEQNNRALSATVQALQVQKMTLSTLKGMNVNLTDLAKAFPFATAAAPAPADASSNLSGWPLSGAAQPAAEAPAQPSAQPSAAPEPEAPRPESPKTEATGAGAAPDAAAQAANMATAMQWWGALTQQFQHIAQQAMQDPAQQQAMAKATQMGSEFAKTAVKTAGDMVRKAVAQVQPVKATASGTAKSTPSKAAPSKAAPAKKAAAKRSAPAKKAVSSDKKPVSAAAKTKGVAAKKSTASKTRAR